MAEVVSGGLSLNSGWWVVLPQPFSLVYEADETLVLESATVIVRPKVFVFDATAMTESTAAVTSEIIDDTVDDSTGRLTSVGDLAGVGWTGSWCGGPAEDGSDEYEVVASLGADDTILNLAISYLGKPVEGQVHWQVEHVSHRPDSAQLTSQLGRLGAHWTVPRE